MRVPVISGAHAWRRAGSLVAVASFAIVSGACGLVTKPTAACSVTIAPAIITVAVNGTQQVVGTAFDCKGNSIAKKTVAFSSSNSAVVTVTPAGIVIGVAVGTATVSAVADGKTGTSPVTVTPEAAQTVTINPLSITLRKTNVRAFTATAKNAQGNVITGRTFTWGSSNSSIASVDQNGQVTALSVGTVNISATTDQITGTSSVIVTEIPIGSCTLSPLSQKITVSNQVQPVVSLKDTAGIALSNVGRIMLWSSSNEIVAGVSSSGVISARKAGTARITASSPDNTSINCLTDIEVVDPRIATVSISPKNGLLRIGVPRQFTVQLLDSVGGQIPAGRVVSWRNPTPQIAIVSATGLVTALALGTAKIAVDAEGAVDTVSLTVTKVPVGTVGVAPLQSSIIQGATVTLTATVTDSAGVVVNDRLLEWQSSNVGLAQVSQTGVVTGLAPGTVNISATSEGKSGSGSVIVNQIPVDSIAADSTFFMVKGAVNQAFQIRLLDSQGNQLTNRTITITSSSPSVALASANQQATIVTVTGLTVGETFLTLRAQSANGQPEGKITRVHVTVTP